MAFVRTQLCHFNGNRAAVRQASAQQAILGLIDLLQ
jgi:nicotinamide mononucleotide (NMN) deamidase PncC